MRAADQIEVVGDLEPFGVEVAGVVAPLPTAKPLPVTLTPTYPGRLAIPGRDRWRWKLRQRTSLSVRLMVMHELSVDARDLLWPSTSECTGLFCPVRLSVRTFLLSQVAELS